MSRNTQTWWVKREQTGDYGLNTANFQTGNGHKITDWQRSESVKQHGGKTRNADGFVIKQSLQNISDALQKIGGKKDPRLQERGD